ncbi:dTDP-glucose 4,6-dehydratase [Winogradskyella sp.]|uniref:dTDP-glucose 4,6-dehydratase n=1 Tax=Winogradskyella sp. TaxID=1883156 RepID=UPI003BA9BF77
MRFILITGGAGFIGSNFISFLLKKYQDISIVNLDKLTYAGELSNLKELEDNKNYTFVKGDICDVALVNELFKTHNFSGVIHFAAESHVDNSIANPDAFINTNVHGTFNLLNTAKNHWMDAPFSFKPGCENNRFHHISTDEVYGTLGKTGLFSEDTPYAPNSPYSASKASSDFIVRSYYHTYGMNVVTTNCSNNYGPKQHNEKLIPTIIRKAINGENIPIYGDGKNVRDWLYVEDHCSGIDLVYQKGRSGETYNIGGKNERDNLYIAHKICGLLDELRPKLSKYAEQITFVTDRPGHDFRYAIDASKIENELGWQAKENFETGIVKTVNWYLNKYENR